MRRGHTRRLNNGKRGDTERQGVRRHGDTKGQMMGAGDTGRRSDGDMETRLRERSQGNKEDRVMKDGDIDMETWTASGDMGRQWHSQGEGESTRCHFGRRFIQPGILSCLVAPSPGLGLRGCREPWVRPSD